jgi:hypothetical protein
MTGNRGQGSVVRDQEPGFSGRHMAESLDDAIHQAEWDFGVKPTEWIEVNEPF